MTAVSIICTIVCALSLVLTVRHRRRAEEALTSVRELIRLTYSDKSPPMLPQLPYRTAGTVETPAVEAIEIKADAVEEVFGWRASLRNSANAKKTTERVAFDCPYCERPWWMNETYCACPRCDVGHFHIECGGALHKDQATVVGCGAKWIMRAATTKKTETAA